MQVKTFLKTTAYAPFPNGGLFHVGQANQEIKRINNGKMMMMQLVAWSGIVRSTLVGAQNTTITDQDKDNI